VPTASRSSSRKRTGARAQRRTASRAVHGTLAELLALDVRGWMVSCYQKLEPGDRAGEKYRIKLKNRLRRAHERVEILGFSHGERRQIGSALEQIEEFFQYPSNLGGGRGVAIFVAPGLFRVVMLPYVLRSRIVIDRTAQVGELVALTEAGMHILAVVADRRSARLFSVSVDGAEEIEGVILPGAIRAGRFRPSRDDAPGTGEYRFHNRIREEKQRHMANVADAVARAWRTRGYDGLVIGGIGVEANAILPHLDTSLRDRVVGVMKLSPKAATAADIRERALELLGEAAEAAAADAVGELLGLEQTGWAVNGVEPTLRALAQGQVRTLLVDHDATVAGFRMSVGGRLTADGAASRAEGEPVPVADLLDDAIEDALRQRARVHVVQGPLARRLDTLAGILRFKAAR
jgi:peptide chain release factor subunit 1